MHHKEIVLITADEGDLIEIPEDISRFLNEQIYNIIGKKIYPKASLFENIQQGKIAIADDSIEEKRSAIMFQLGIGNTNVVWACPDCQRIIGLIAKLPPDLKEKHPSITQDILSGFFLLYAQRERLKCPNCMLRSQFLLKPTFLISGQPIQSQIDMAYQLGQR